MDEAFADFNKAIEINPKYVQAHEDRGTIYNSRKEFDRAIADFNTALSLDPHFSSAYVNRAISNFSKGDLDRAIADSTMAISLNPNFNAFLNRGAFYHERGEPDRAIADALKAMEIRPDAYEPYYNLAFAFAAKGELGKSCEYLNMAVQKGFRDWDQLERSADQGHLKKSDCFRKILEKIKK